LPILAVTPNPSIDRSLVIPGYQIGAIHRPERVVVVAGGKGLNVARSAKLLGASVEACILLAGHNGKWIQENLERENIPAWVTWCSGETRICTSIIDTQNWKITEVYEYGDPINMETWKSYEDSFTQALADKSWVTFSGSLLPGAPVDGFARLVEIAHRQSVPAIVDIHGQPLREALKAHPQLVKVNATEASEATGVHIDAPEAAVQAAQAFRQLGASQVVITLGEKGAVAFDGFAAWYGKLPPVQAIALVGSGDAFLAGFVTAIRHGALFQEALALAVAIGAANTLEVGQGIFDLKRVDQLKTQVQIKRIG